MDLVCPILTKKKKRNKAKLKAVSNELSPNKYLSFRKVAVLEPAMLLKMILIFIKLFQRVFSALYKTYNK